MPTSGLRPSLGNLPASLSAFIGREREVAEVRQMLANYRLVTLTGPGGCGKTRLALRLATEMQPAFEDGVWLAALAPLSDPGLVPQAVASALRIRAQRGRSLTDLLAEYLSSRHVMLVMDNCEHLITACAGLAEMLLSASPALRILATSRETLDVTGEAAWVVPPMSLPEPQPRRNPVSTQVALHAYERSEAVSLFVDRGRMVSSSFELTAENGGWVAEICSRLDGMPLSIELAAARVRTLSPRQIAERLDDRFHLLTGGSRTAPPRQQTLAATLDWSYALLSQDERKVFQRLSTFSGGGTLQAAESVCAGKGIEAGEVLDLLSRLADKSLVVVDRPEGGETRYRLLETIREYARGKLADSGEAEAAKDRHLDYFVLWAEEAGPGLSGPERSDWPNRFELEHDNIRAALQWSLVSLKGASAGLRLALASSSFWKLRGYHTEGRMRLSDSLAHEGTRQPTIVRAKALVQASALAFYQSDYPAARAFSEEGLTIARELGVDGRPVAADALEMLAEVATETGHYAAARRLYEQVLVLYKELGDLASIGSTLYMLGWVAMRSGDYERAEWRLEEGLVACRESGTLHQVSSALAGLGELAVRRGQYERAREFLGESLDITRRTQDTWLVAVALGSLGWVALRQRDFHEMRRLLGESLELRMETGDRGGMAWCLERLAEAADLEGQPEKAVRTFGAAATLRAPSGSIIDSIDQPEHDRILSGLRTALGQQAFDSLWAEGQAMALEAVVDYALSEPEESAARSAPSDKERFGGLTEREREVAGLIAQGKSNREIARAMTVGVKTIETYVTRILNKLGFDSRVQIATWAIEVGLYRK